MASRHIPALDGIRGIAIFWVVLHNTTAIPLAPSGPWGHVVRLLLSRGWIGVDLFFGLSGFLITAGLLDTQHTRHYFRNFYAKRALRILPLYYSVLLLLLFVLPHMVGGLPYNLDHQAPLWLFIANWTQSFPFGFGHFWSLAVEEQFYLVWPLIIWALPAPRLLKTCLGIVVAVLVLRCALAAYGVDGETLRTNTVCRLDSLALGGGAACVLRIPALHDTIIERRTQLVAGASLLLLGGIPLTRMYDNAGWRGETFGYTFLAIGSSALVLWTALSDGGAANGAMRLLNWSPLRSCGKYSYAIYIFHNLLHKLLGEAWLMARFGKMPPLPAIFVYALAVFAISYVAALCSYHALEKHFLKLKRFFAAA